MKQGFTSRTVGEVYIIRETYCVYTSPRLVRLVKQWFTSRTIGELRRLHTDDKQFCRTHTTREWLERQTCYRQCIFFALKTWMPRIAKHDEYSSFSKRESPIAPEYISTVLFGVPKQERLNALLRMYVSRSEIVNAPKHNTQWIFFVLKAWEPKSALYTLLIRTGNRERNTRKTMRALRIRSEKGNAPMRKAQWIFFILKTWEPNSAIYIYSALRSPKAGV